MSRGLDRGGFAPDKALGFSMIEVLISLVLIAIAMLGAANLQLQALKMGKGAAFRMHAVTLAMEIGERMEANRTGAVTNPSPYTTATVAVPATAARAIAKDCTSAACTATELANFDLGSWETSLVARLPAASWSITNTTAGNPSTYSIVVSWQDRRDANTYATAGTTESFSYTAIKTVVQ